MDLDEARVGKSLADRSLDGERERNKTMCSSMLYALDISCTIFFPCDTGLQ